MRYLFIDILFSKLYNLLKYSNDKINRLERLKHLQNVCQYKPDTIISDEAIIENFNRINLKIRIGSNCWIRGYLLVFNHGGEISIGDDCFIGKNTRIWSSSKISIGNRVLISHNVEIHDNNSHPIGFIERHKDYLFIKKHGKLDDSLFINEKEIIIEDDVWIGFNVIILKGIKIGRGSIIGAGSIITNDVPPFTIVYCKQNQIFKSLDT